MIKKILCILLCAAMLLPMTACNTNDPTNDLLESLTESMTGEPTTDPGTDPGTEPDTEPAPPVDEQPRPVAVIKDTLIYLFEGDSIQLRYSTDANGVTNAKASDIVWTASTNCVSVQKGKVTALKQGYAYVSGGGDTQCLIRIVPKDMPELVIDAGGVKIVRDENDPDKYYNCTISLTAASNPAFNLKDEVGGIRVRGNSTARAAKAPYRIKFASKLNLLGLNEGAECKSWVLLSDPYDDSMIRNTTALTLASTIIDNYSADWRYVKLTLNGEYRGVYVLTEQNQIDENRINIEEAGTDTTNVMSGYLFEMDGSPPHTTDKIRLSYEDMTITTFHGKLYNNPDIKYHTTDRQVKEIDISIKNDDLTVEQLAFARKYMTNLFQIIYAATQENKYYEFDKNFDLVEVENSDSQKTLSKIINIDSLIRMLIHSEIVSNGDQTKKSFYMWVDFSKDGNGLLTFGCPWDFDSAFCGYKSYSFQRIDYIFAAKRNPWYVMISRCDWFREEVCRVWDEVYEESNGFWNTSYVLDNIVKYYKDEIDGDAKLWKRTHDHEEYAVLTRDWVEEHLDWLNKHYDLEYEKSKWLNP